MSDNNSREGSNSVAGMAGQAPSTVNIDLEVVTGRQISAAFCRERPMTAGIESTKCN